MGAGSTKNTRDSKGQRLGVKIFGNQHAKSGAIIVRQRGTKFLPGLNTGLGKDFTIFAKTNGIVKFSFEKKNKKRIDIIPLTAD